MIKKQQGYKHENDTLVTINGHVLTYMEALDIILTWMKNEDLLYPPSKGFQGARMLQSFFIKFIQERRLPTEEERKSLKLSKHIPLDKF